MDCLGCKSKKESQDGGPDTCIFVWHYQIIWRNNMDEKSRYRVYKLEREKDLFCSVLNFNGTGSANVFQIADTDYFYSAYYFSDGNLTDINLYYVRSKKLQDIVARKGNVLKFESGTEEWDFHKGELKDIYCWLFVLKIMFTSSKEIKEIFKLDDAYQKENRIQQITISKRKIWKIISRFYILITKEILRFQLKMILYL